MPLRGRGRAVFVLLGALALGCWRELDPQYRGWLAVDLGATGRFRVAQVGGVWWFVTPKGHPFFSLGVDSASSYGDFAPALGTYPYRDHILARYGSEAAWADRVLERFRFWGINTVGAWSQTELFAGRYPYTVVLSLAAAAPAVAGTAGSLAKPVRDFFDPAFDGGLAARLGPAQACAQDPYCIGVFSDNELPWGSPLAQTLSFVQAYLRLPAGAPGKVELQRFFVQRYGGDVAAFDAVWGESLASFDELQQRTGLGGTAGPGDPAAMLRDRVAFRGHVAERYFRVVHDALRAIDPSLLILGARFLAFSTGPAVAAAAGRWVDVLSVNAYEWRSDWMAALPAIAAEAGLIPSPQLFEDVDEMHRITGKPILIGEFGYRAADSGLPNTWPPVYPVLADQAARADAFERYMDAVLARPYIVGAHWFEYEDQPASGRFDGENNNWGIVDIHDDPYPWMLARFAEVAASLYPKRFALAGGP